MKTPLETQTYPGIDPRLSFRQSAPPCSDALSGRGVRYFPEHPPTPLIAPISPACPTLAHDPNSRLPLTSSTRMFCGRERFGTSAYAWQFGTDPLWCSAVGLFGLLCALRSIRRAPYARSRTACAFGIGAYDAHIAELSIVRGTHQGIRRVFARAVRGSLRRSIQCEYPKSAEDLRVSPLLLTTLLGQENPSDPLLLLTLRLGLRASLQRVASPLRGRRDSELNHVLLSVNGTQRGLTSGDPSTQRLSISVGRCRQLDALKIGQFASE
ncbi:hypothetical protein C8Q70DRAFT_520325 [Cubamyces menziesii]|nr:hypothetical protein C8Q70DRAFT_520325 [Cubamyces menziesii]